MNSQEHSQSHAIMDMKQYPPFGSSFDVHSPLLESLSYPAVDSSRLLSSNIASTSLNLAIQSNIHQRAMNVMRTNSASEKEIELSAIDSVDSVLARTASETGVLHTHDRQVLFPVASEGFVTSCADRVGQSKHSMSEHSSLENRNIPLRIGIIPAGSTDTVAISTTGSRDLITAALHIILGDSMPLNVVRITGWRKSPQSGDELQTVRYAASFAGYGFYGDVIKESEPTRWMGPARYDIAGVKVFMKHKKYDEEVSFLDIPMAAMSCSSSGEAPQSRVVCRTNCFICCQSVDLSHLVNDDSEVKEDLVQMQPGKPRWRTTRDAFHSIGAAVISCRNDKAPDGVAAHAHLADGLLHLILIRRCSRPNYLRQLITLTRTGADPF